MHKQQSQLTLGWDVGGAHLKAALIDTAGVAIQVIQVACPLWQGVDKLEFAIQQILNLMPANSYQHAVTMTGELADIFPDRNSGVLEIANVMTQQLTGSVLFYAGQAGFVAIDQVSSHTSLIASANWLASASYIAREFHQGLLIDFGSTTTDFILIADGKPQIRGYSDAARQQYDELVYTGMIRTPLMSLASHVPFEGEWCGLAAEHFATTADVYRLTGLLNECDDMSPSADGADKTQAASARRIARMIGRDLGDAEMSAWVNLAHAFKHIQLGKLKSAALRHLSLNLIAPQSPIIGAGAGSQVLQALAQQLNRKFYDATHVISAHTDEVKKWAGICLPAYAVASLALKYDA